MENKLVKLERANIIEDLVRDFDFKLFGKQKQDMYRRTIRFFMEGIDHAYYSRWHTTKSDAKDDMANVLANITLPDVPRNPEPFRVTVDYDDEGFHIVGPNQRVRNVTLKMNVGKAISEMAYQSRHFY
ncbi:hypothetical protein [Wenling hepe-like virus 1]|uniref:hypothetical protein n=1 Tax=Wenling hepe-like virus 1 TaxID=1923493 RepID=UPI00090B5A6C|nr:hypothetical protein [Wenling hepe-like virus 1]APG77827.1 hypothetical protein [Wenling hepe-like virus 1]